MSVRVALLADGPLVEALFLARKNQFLVEASLRGATVHAHMADRGRLLGLLIPNAKLLLAPRNEIGRKTAFQVIGVYHDGELVSLDTHLPNRLIKTALSAQALPQFSRYTKIQPEFTIGEHRFDFRLGDGLSTCVLEVKSVGMVRDGLAMFPDAPTVRGTKQVEMLRILAQNGQRTAVLFAIQRHHAQAFVPNEEIDPAFAQTLRRAIAGGVEVYAYRCPVTPAGITLEQGVPVFGSLQAVPSHVA